MELLQGTSGATYLLTKSKARSLPKWTNIAGCGTGRWVPADSKEDGYGPLDFSEGDKTVVQIDESGFDANKTGIVTQSLYRYYITLERLRKVSKYDTTHLKVSRKSDGEGFDITVDKPHKYMEIKLGGKAPAASSATWFRGKGKAATELPTSQFLQVLPRFSFSTCRGDDFLIGGDF